MNKVKLSVLLGLCQEEDQKMKVDGFARSKLDSKYYSAIDSILKDLRLASQRLANIAGYLQDELKFLERLYYKNLNQHKNSVYWRRIVEVRRFGRRIQNVDVLGIIEYLRYSFFSQRGQKDTKLLKNAWSYAPSLVLVRFILKRLKSTYQLASKARDSVGLAHESLILLMRSGAFLQFAVVLLAIVSRLGILLEELLETLVSAESASTRLLDCLSNATSTLTDILSNALESAKVKEEAIANEGFEDIRTVNTTDNVETLVSKTKTRVSHTTPPALLEEKSIVTNELVTSASTLPTCRVNPTKSSAKDGKSLKKKEGRKRRDEIDDIFAGL